MIQKEQRNFIMRDGKKVYAILWSDTDITPTQSIVLVHGMAEHIDRYEGFARDLVSRGFVVLGYNERGHRFTDEKENYGYNHKCDVWSFGIMLQCLKYGDVPFDSDDNDKEIIVKKI